MGFVGNYAHCGLSPQTDGMPVILKKAREKSHGPLAENDYFVICEKQFELPLQISVPFLGKNIPDICLHRGIYIIEGRFVYIS